MTREIGLVIDNENKERVPYGGKKTIAIDNS
jgi:hypothetical protein